MSEGVFRQPWQRPPRRAASRWIGSSPAGPASVLGLTFVYAHDLVAGVSFISSPGYVIARKAGAGQAAPTTSTDPGWTEVASVYPGTGGSVPVTLPTNDDDYTIAVASRALSPASTSAFVVIDAFGLDEAELLAWDATAAVGRITTTRQCRARFEIDREVSWPEGEASLTIDAGLRSFPADVGVAPDDLLGDESGSPFPPDGHLPAGSEGTFVRVALPAFASRRYIRFSQGSGPTA